LQWHSLARILSVAFFFENEAQATEYTGEYWKRQEELLSQPGLGSCRIVLRGREISWGDQYYQQFMIGQMRSGNIVNAWGYYVWLPGVTHALKL